MLTSLPLDWHLAEHKSILNWVQKSWRLQTMSQNQSSISLSDFLDYFADWDRPGFDLSQVVWADSD